MSEPEKKEQMQADSMRPLDKINYILIGISVVLIVVGFLLMCGKPSTDTAFNPDIFSTVRIAVGPTIAFIGFVAIFFAILYKKK